MPIRETVVERLVTKVALAALFAGFERARGGVPDVQGALGCCRHLWPFPRELRTM